MQTETRKPGIEIGIYTFGDSWSRSPNWKNNKYSTAPS